MTLKISPCAEFGNGGVPGSMAREVRRLHATVQGASPFYFVACHTNARALRGSSFVLRRVLHSIWSPAAQCRPERGPATEIIDASAA